MNLACHYSSAAAALRKILTLDALFGSSQPPFCQLQIPPPNRAFLRIALKRLAAINAKPRKKERRVRKQIKEKGKRRFRLFTCPWNIIPLMRVSMATARLFSATSLCWHNFCLNLRLFFRADAPVVRCKKHILAAISAVCYSI